MGASVVSGANLATHVGNAQCFISQAKFFALTHWRHFRQGCNFDLCFTRVIRCNQPSQLAGAGEIHTFSVHKLRAPFRLPDRAFQPSWLTAAEKDLLPWDVMLLRCRRGLLTPESQYAIAGL
jgi:hypothetical protein